MSTSSKYEPELEIALAAVTDACRIAEAVGRTLTNADHMRKSDRSPVTVADFGIQAVVNAHLRAAFPHDCIIAEEDSAELGRPENAALLASVSTQVARVMPKLTAAKILRAIDHGNDQHGAPERFWTLDPVDGTKGFLRGDQYAIALALIEDGLPVLGVLACPRLGGTGAIFGAIRGAGAFRLDQGERKPIHVSKRPGASDAIFCESFESGHSAHSVSARVIKTLGTTAAPIRLDSQAKYALVATGEGDVYLRLPTREDYREKIWDHAAGALLVEAAGGRVTDIHGKSLDFSRGNTLAANQGIIATNGLLHDAVLVAVSAAGVRA